MNFQPEPAEASTTVFKEACGVCGDRRWQIAYRGPIRDGAFGRTTPATVFRCASCGVGFLPTSVGLSPHYYEGREYRESLGEGADAEAFFRLHDDEQFRRYPMLEQVPLRGRVVADVGCAGGAFLDGVRGFAAATIGIEPAVAYRDSLRSRGHLAFGDLSAAASEWSGRVDLAVCFSVIEHVERPTEFLREIRRLLSPAGRLLLSTPNADDMLLSLGCDRYAQFFYRAVHTYYFDRRSLAAAAREAGFAAFEPRFVQRYGFGNFIGWLADGRPTGDERQHPLGSRFDRLWRVELEEAGRADYLYAWLHA